MLDSAPRPYWKPQAIWKGETAFILGGGPSLNNVDLSGITHRKVIGVNNAYRLGQWIDFCWFGDAKWWKKHSEELKLFKGKIAHCNESTDVLKVSTIYHFKRGIRTGIDVRPGFVSWNSNSGASAVNFAYHLGARDIVLVGFDMKQVNNRKNWHDDHDQPSPGVLSCYPNYDSYLNDIFGRFMAGFDAIAANAETLGVRITNCTPGSSMKSFPVMGLEDFLKHEESPEAHTSSAQLL